MLPSYNAALSGRYDQELKVHIEVLKSYWSRCVIKSSHSIGDASEIACYISLIGKLLKKEMFITNSGPNSKSHILFEVAIEMDLFNHLCKILGNFHGDQQELMKETVLQFYDTLMSCPFYELFLKKEFVYPMMVALNVCGHRSSVKIENQLLQTLHTICVALHQQVHPQNTEDDLSITSPSELFWNICLNPCSSVYRNAPVGPDNSLSTSTDVSDTNEAQSICDLLVNYVRRDGSLCWLSRDSLLLLAASSTANEHAGYLMANSSKLCEVLVTDMVLLFTNTPRQLVKGGSADDWPALVTGMSHQLDKDQPMQKFLDHYEFCCSIMDMSNHLVKENMLDCVYKGFLLPVLAPQMQSTCDAELATTTMYFERILCKSKGTILLPFLLRFLFSDRNATHANGLTPQSFRHGVTQALEQSFPFSDASFYHGVNGFLGQGHAKTYMDMLLKRIQYCNSLVGVATLSLMNTITDLLCEDVTFELVLKYLLPYGAYAPLEKVLTTPSSFLISASRYLSLIPPYTSVSAQYDNLFMNANGKNWCSSENGDLSSFEVDEAVVRQLEAEADRRPSGDDSHTYSHRNRIRCCLQESRKLIAERRAACSDWHFPYDLGNPPPSLAARAHMNENILTPLPQEGLQLCDTNYTLHVGSDDTSKQTISRPNQWELDDLNQVAVLAEEDDSILADLERFSAILREPERPTYTRKASVKMRNRGRLGSSRRRRDNDAEEIKRTSSLYDISYVDPDEVTESTEVRPPAAQPNCPDRMIRSAIDRRDSTGSDASSITSRSVELSLTESSEQLPAGVKKIVENGDVPDLMRYLDQLPGGEASFDSAVVEARFASCMQQFERGGRLQERRGKPRQNGAEHPKVGKTEVDSGVASVDSALMRASMHVGSASSEAASVYAGPFLSTILQLTSQMPSNHLYVNLQLTRLLLHLLALPLPLLRLQLLPLPAASTVERLDNGGSASQQGLFATLLSVRQWFDCYINLHFAGAASGNSTLLASLMTALRQRVFQPSAPGGSGVVAKKTSVVAARTHNGDASQPQRRMSWLLTRLNLGSLIPSPPDSPPSSPKSFVSQNGSAASFEDAFNAPAVSASDWRRLAMARLTGVVASPNEGPLKSVKDVKSREVLVALLVFEEFCREMASLCMEHSVSL